MKSTHAAAASGLALALALSFPLAASQHQGEGAKAQESATSTQSGEGMERGQAGTGQTGSAGDQIGRAVPGEPTVIGDPVEGRSERMATVSRRADEVTGVTIVNEAGEDIGEVDAIVRNMSTDEVHAVVSVGGFLGIGDKDLVIPLTSLQVKEQQLVAPFAGEEEAAQAWPEYEERRFQEVSGDEMVSLGAPRAQVAGSRMEKGTQGGSGMPSFSTLDKDDDGYVRKQDVEDGSRVSQHWDRIDRNQDDRIDASEFAAFEMSEEGGRSGKQEESGYSYGTSGARSEERSEHEEGSEHESGSRY